ncbi:SGNH/GDSL hydrolase family protein [Acuticoccus sediminis]|uniref:SGNH/GDSL hydrolase family protein n=1 Tax=Acuticoccus sediminis TaxID=2184697 RepID=UPI001CFD54BF|nr:SGNH/GDSL hydrolase family protein [Acuticoccus sediminis]
MRTPLTFDEIVYFGASYTDSGVFFEASEKVAIVPIPFEAAGYDHQFSNGPVYADLVPGLIGVTGGEDLNYAVGGARISDNRNIEDLIGGTVDLNPFADEDDLNFGVDYRHEVARYLNSGNADGDLSNVAASIYIGNNDTREFEIPDGTHAEIFAAAEDYGRQLANSLLVQTRPLLRAGVETLIFNNLSNVEVFPASNASSDFIVNVGDHIVEAFNTALETIADRIETRGFATTELIDLGLILEEVTRDASSFRFRDADLAVNFGEGSTPVPNPAARDIPVDQIAFFDQVHPTTEFHQIIAAYQAESLTSNVIVGTDDNDPDLMGTRGDDFVIGLDGRDTIILDGGNDVAMGGRGDDVIDGGAGSDLIIGGSGNDQLVGGGRIDIIADGDGDDAVQGGDGGDLILAGAGNDTIRGGDGRDFFVFTDPELLGRNRGDDHTVIVGNGGVDTLFLAVEDASEFDVDPNATVHDFGDLGLTVGQVENIVVVEGLDFEINARSAQFAEADLWHLV